MKEEQTTRPGLSGGGLLLIGLGTELNPPVGRNSIRYLDPKGGAQLRLLNQSLILASKFFMDFTNLITFRCKCHSAFFGGSFAVVTGVLRHSCTPQVSGERCVSQSPTRSTNRGDARQ